MPLVRDLGALLAKLPADNQPDAGYEITQFNDFAGIRRYEESTMIYEPEDIADDGELTRRIFSWAAGRPLLTGIVVAHQTFGDMLLWNPHFYAIVLEGGFDEAGTFVYIPFSGLQSMKEVSAVR